MVCKWSGKGEKILLKWGEIQDEKEEEKNKFLHQVWCVDDDMRLMMTLLLSPLFSSSPYSFVLPTLQLLLIPWIHDSIFSFWLTFVRENFSTIHTHTDRHTDFHSPSPEVIIPSFLFVINEQVMPNLIEKIDHQIVP